jgi:hypothetical protein
MPPAADAGLPATRMAETTRRGQAPEDADVDVMTLTPLAALEMLAAYADALVRPPADVPPTPPASSPATPLAQADGAKENGAPAPSAELRAPTKTPIGSPVACPSEPLHATAGRDGDDDGGRAQNDALARRFDSKQAAAISPAAYLGRIHRYCPMSTAVYLAAGTYLHALAHTHRRLAVSGRNLHRLVLAGLRVAAKALDDGGHAQLRFAAVAGVSEPELARLELSFCFLMDFDLRVDRPMLTRQAWLMRDALRLQALPPLFSGR